MVRSLLFFVVREDAHCDQMLGKRVFDGVEICMNDMFWNELLHDVVGPLNLTAVNFLGSFVHHMTAQMVPGNTAAQSTKYCV